MRRTVAGLVLAVLVVAALGAGYLAVTTGRQTSTSNSMSSGNGAFVVGYLPDVSGSILANSSTGAGLLDLQVRNMFGYPFAGIALVGVSPLLPDVINNMTFTYNGTSVNASNPLPQGQVANGIAEFGSGGVVGSNHTVDVAVMQANGQDVTATASLSVGVLTLSKSPAYAVNGTLVVPNGTGNGTLTVEVHDDAINEENPNNYSVNTFYMTAVIPTTLTLPTRMGAVNATTTTIVANVSDLGLTYDGSPVSPTNPVPAGGSVTGSINVADVTAGVEYQVNIVIHFSNDESASGTLSITAQL
jgi:hypothetical protein